MMYEYWLAKVRRYRPGKKRKLKDAIWQCQSRILYRRKRPAQAGNFDKTGDPAAVLENGIRKAAGRGVEKARNGRDTDDTIWRARVSPKIDTNPGSRLLRFFVKGDLPPEKSAGGSNCRSKKMYTLRGADGFGVW